jgi:hypothetical protein
MEYWTSVNFASTRECAPMPNIKTSRNLLFCRGQGRAPRDTTSDRSALAVIAPGPQPAADRRRCRWSRPVSVTKSHYVCLHAAQVAAVMLACSVGVAECHGHARKIDLARCLPGEPPPGTAQVR